MTRPISIHAARPGDILASEVITASGNVIMPSGLTLTDEILENLRLYGVYTLIIRK
ncbi:hypothetical protein [Paenibacillus paeoniae]|uniref:hypothetical protein n=1 Tax=Paenibacillus paeoniae TaxID=2292705 RepID=UPI0014022A0C|nr:hypothetical protein [Paenibacillus paeoniae]